MGKGIVEYKIGIRYISMLKKELEEEYGLIVDYIPNGLKVGIKGE